MQISLLSIPYDLAPISGVDFWGKPKVRRLYAWVPEANDKAIKRVMQDDRIWGDRLGHIVCHWEMDFDERAHGGKPVNRAKFWLA